MISLRYRIKLLFYNKVEKEFCVFAKTQLGIIPRNPNLYRKALTHKSALNNQNSAFVGCNERLEFLGDSLLDSIIAEFLFTHYNKKDEGFLTKMRSKIVNRKSLNQLALQLKLDRYLISNNLNLRNNNALGNAFEALIGAIYLDKGYNFTKKYVTENILEKYIDFNFLERVDTNFKSKLIEVVQRNRYQISFDTVEHVDYSNAQSQFLSTISINGNKLCDACGPTKKEAEQNASKKALQLLEK